jgi:hypothetical protein
MPYALCLIACDAPGCGLSDKLRREPSQASDDAQAQRLIGQDRSDVPSVGLDVA